MYAQGNGDRLTQKSLIMTLCERLDQGVAHIVDDQVFLNRRAIETLCCAEIVSETQTLPIEEFFRVPLVAGHLGGLALEALQDEIQKTIRTQCSPADVGSFTKTLDIEILQDSDGSMAWVFSETFPNKPYQPPLSLKSPEEAFCRSSNEKILSDLPKRLATPLNGVMGMARLLLRSNPTDKRQLYGSVIANCGAELATTVSAVTEFYSLQVEPDRTEAESIDLSALIVALLEGYQSRAEQKNLELRRDFDRSLPKMVCIDRQKLTRLMMILLDSAVQFTDFGSIAVSVRLVDHQPDEGGQLIEFAVTDTGCGIPESDFDAIFEPFVQLQAAGSATGTGSGLGLSMARVLARQLDANIVLESDVPCGTTIRLTVPFTATNLSASQAPHQMSNRPSTLPNTALMH